jgi:hypothetical protein
MKKFVGIALLFIFLITSCSGDEEIEQPPSNKDLLIGSWSSSSVTRIISVNGIETLRLDSAISGRSFTFESNFNVFTSVDGMTDTSRYNVDGDTLYFIKNALAFDTAVISYIDQANLLLALDLRIDKINGNILRQEYVFNYSKQ